MAEKYRIVSDGRVTQILGPDGTEIKHVQSMEITQSAENRTLLAKVSLLLIQPELDIVIQPKNG